MRHTKHLGGSGLAALIALLVCLPLTGCGSGSDGLPGAPGANGVSTGTLTGTITNDMTGLPLEGAEIELVPDVLGSTVMTDASGGFMVTLPAGIYEMNCARDGYEDHADAVSVLAGETMTHDMGMHPEEAVLVTIGGAPSPAPTETPFDLLATVESYNGTTAVGYGWSQLNSVTATIVGSGDAATVTLPAADVYMQELRSHVETPERWDVLPVNPHSLEEGIGITVLCEVTMSDGETYTGSAHITADVPWAAWASGLRNVPIGVPVILNGKTQASYDWTLMEAPGGSAATLNAPSTINPWFIPDASGKYVLRVYDEDPDVLDYVEVIVWAGQWDGGINGHLPDDPGTPQDESLIVTTSCASGCHASTHREQFDDWAATGHAHIFTVNINTGGHYGTGCFDCHTLGWNQGVANGGFDDATDYADFYAAIFPDGHHHRDPGNWDWMLDNTPDTASKANIQCEHCHGPNGNYGDAHNWYSGSPPVDETHPRFDVRADVCATCHGEPLRHARFQQWQESGHGNYETAMAESRTSCNKCHTAQGYLAWFNGDPQPSLTPDEAHPITCVVCHDPHNVGTQSGAGNDAPLRVEDEYLDTEAGFDMTNVGKGAMCMTCHNGRRGLQNDLEGISAPDRAPHGGPQSDVLFGQNAFFVTTGIRGDHSFLDDTCVTCHVELTPPPADLSYNLGGTNHSFEASLAICTDCHGLFDGGTIIDAFEDELHHLKEVIEDAYYDQLEALTNAGYMVQFNDG
ncbi:MAG: hypothetical protein ACYTG6_10295, partial [Planctomycetota bacterium]